MKLFERFKGLKLSGIFKKKNVSSNEGESSAPLPPKFNFKNSLKKFKERMPKNLEELRGLSPEEVVSKLLGENSAERMRELMSGKAYGTYVRLGIASVAAYYLADTVSLFTDALIPEPPVVPPPRFVKKAEKTRSIDEYGMILTRNIFSSKNLVPEDEPGGPARKTTLPLNLVGTVVLADELKSIATIEDKSQNMIFPLRIDDTLNGQIRVMKIERLRVYFINQSTGHNEYVEIVDDLPKLNISAAAAPSKGKSSDGISQVGDNKFEIEKNAIEKTLSNIGEVLQQARAVPNFENGMQDGYKLIQIAPNSLYSQLGLKDGDVIDCVNGEPINDPAKAFALFNEIRTLTKLELCVKRNGKKTVMNYDVR